MPPPCFAQSLSAVNLMPSPGSMVALTPAFTPAHLKGMVIHPEDPFKLDFLIFRGDAPLEGDRKKAEYTQLVKYFLASLTVPDRDQWVNLSPYENDRIVPENFGLTAMGRDLLAQDYLLKQISASLINPDTDLGRKFWDGVYAQAHERFGTTNISDGTFNKVWITPDKAVVHEKGNSVIILEHHLKVMLESDYKAMKENGVDAVAGVDTDAVTISKQVMRDVIIPAIEKEVNEGRNFAPLRQVYSSMLLACWYKGVLKGSILSKVYADKGKMRGVDQDPKNNEAIYNQYVAAFKNGVFNMIREEADSYTREVIPRKYFSGGINPEDFSRIIRRNDGAGVVKADATVMQKGLERVAVVLNSAPSTTGWVIKVIQEEGRKLVTFSKSDGTEIIRKFNLDDYMNIVRYFQSMVNQEQIPLRDDKEKFVAGLFLSAGSAVGNVLYVKPNEIQLFRQWLDAQVVMLENVTNSAQAITEEYLQAKFGALEEAMKVDFMLPDGKGLASFVMSMTPLLSMFSTQEMDSLNYRLGVALRKIFNETEYFIVSSYLQQMLLGRTAKDLVQQDQDHKVPYAGPTQGSKGGKGTSVDQAGAVNGGIDFAQSNLDMQIRRDGAGVPLPVSQQDLDSIHIEGLVPEILSIQPASGMPLFRETDAASPRI